MKVVTARIGDLNSQRFRKGIRALAIATITTLVLTSCSLIPGANKAFKTIEEYQSQSLKWGKCYETFTCAYLKVPIDYTNLELGTFKIALIKYKATQTKEKNGSIVVNPGGPGASGVDYAYNAEYIFDKSVLKKYDLVGFDPRGISRSEPIICLNDEETDAAYAADSKPDSPAEFAALIKASKEYAKKCRENTKHVTHYSTADSARDMDLLRAALGDSKLNFLGKSYGTYLGTLYAQFFPDKVGRMVLDGALNPNITIKEQNLTQTIGFEQALDALAPLDAAARREAIESLGLDQPNFRDPHHADAPPTVVPTRRPWRSSAAIEGACDRLLAVRDARRGPRRDTKVILEWNGLLVEGLAAAGLALGDDRLVKRAAGIAEAIWGGGCITSATPSPSSFWGGDIGTS
jgi:pimeloyl-ACP methyl ester carboxylesterase